MPKPMLKTLLKTLAALAILFTLAHQVFLASPRSARAEDRLFDEYFTSGWPGWSITGTVISSGTFYWSSANSARLEGAATLYRTLSTVNSESISLHWHVFANSLETGEACEIQVDTGSGYTTLASVADGADDGYWRYAITSAGAAANNNANFKVRFQGNTNNEAGDYCYVDDFTLIGTPLGEKTLYFNNFDTGSSSLAGWTYGAGVIPANDAYYWLAPYSVRFQGLSTLTRTISTVGYSNLKITYHLLGGYLEAGEACRVEYNTGSGWTTGYTLADGSDDWWYRWGSFALGAAANNNPNFQVRLGGSPSNEWILYQEYDYCYTDDFRVSGLTSGTASPTPTNTGGPTATPTRTNTPAPTGTQSPTPTPTNTAPPTPTFTATANSAQIPGDPLGGDGNVSRTLLTYTDLTNVTTPAAPVSEAAFALPFGAEQPNYFFEGKLTLNNEATQGGYTSVRDDYNIANLDPAWKHIPEFAYEFVQNGSHLIPVTRPMTTTAHIGWNYIIGPGRVWKEDADNGYSRAAFPFALVEKNANCTHNGVIMFLFKNSPATISNVHYQITQETCQYHKFNMYGELSASYTNSTIPNAATIKSAYAQEWRDKLVIKPFDQLDNDYPNVALTQYGYGITPEHITSKGLYYNGTLYLEPCGTRYGQYAFCENIALSSFSTAKSAFAGAALMALGQDYGETTVYTRLIKDYVPEYTAATGLWTTVSFNHTLDMVTGNYNSSVHDEDEAGTVLSDFFLAATDADKRNFAFDFPNKTAPGAQFVYHSSDTYLLTQAMDKYLEAQQGAGADIYTYLKTEVLDPLKINPMTAGTTLRTYVSGNGNNGQPFGGYGMFWTPDAIAKIGKFLTTDDGKIGGAQVLNANMLADSLQEDATDRGLATGVSGLYYNNGFWAKQFGAAEGFSCTFWVPMMSGYGGISVALMPNSMGNIVYFVFSDNGEYKWSEAVIESKDINDPCS